MIDNRQMQRAQAPRLDTASRVRPVYRDTADFLAARASERATLLFSEQVLADRVVRFTSCFPGITTYAVKANPDEHILAALSANGITEFDAASPGEIQLLKQQLPGATINYNNPIRTEADLEQAYQAFGVRSFVIDDAAGLAQLERLGARDIEVTVRLKLAHENAAYNFGSKFGASTQDATDLLRSARSLRFDRLSMTFHPGSQCSSVAVYEKYIDACAAVSADAGVELDRLNVGGGFPVAYADAVVPPLDAYFEAIGKRSAARFGREGPDLLCEPGRALVGPSCSLLTRVTHVRTSEAVFLDEGVFGCLQEQILLNSKLPLRVWREDQALAPGGPEREIFGPTCDPSDKLAARYQLTGDIAVGDWVEFALMGAYSATTATRFNGIDLAQYAQVEQGYVPE